MVKINSSGLNKIKKKFNILNGYLAMKSSGTVETNFDFELSLCEF
jgi:hypothetical protein